MIFVDDANIPQSPYPELRDVLHLFVDAISAELKDNLVGVYLIGSIATGDFDLDSDVDFLVVTHTDLPDTEMRPLQAIQARIFAIDGYPAKHLEGSYISLGDLDDWSTVGQKRLLYFDNGSTTCELAAHDNQWHVRWILRERGVTLVGPQPRTFVRAIPIPEMMGETKRVMLENQSAFQEKMDQPLCFWNSRFGQSFFVLMYCRFLHTLRTGTIQSKKAGAVWAKQHVDSRWIGLIDQAWNERVGVRFGVKIGQRADAALLRQTLAFIQYAVAQMEHSGLQGVD